MSAGQAHQVFPVLSRDAQRQKLDNLVAQLKECSRLRDLTRGKKIHSQATEWGLESNKYMASSLINMYAKCGSIADAREVFTLHSASSSGCIVCWNALLGGYSSNGEYELVLDLLDAMEEAAIPNSVTYLAALVACTALAKRDAELQHSESVSCWLQKGKAIHSRAVMDGCCDTFICNKLVNVYSKCGSMRHAASVFSSMRNVDRSVVSWNSLLRACVEHGENELALGLFEQEMQEDDQIELNALTYTSILEACANLVAKEQEETGQQELSARVLELGKVLHSRAMISACCNKFVQGNLMKLYVMCGAIEHARSLLHEGSEMVCWNILLKGYVENGQSQLALEIFDDMMEEAAATGFSPDERTYIAALTACATLAGNEDGEGERNGPESRFKWLEKGKAIHSDAVTAGCCNEFVQNSLISMYAKCGSMVHAQAVFDNMFQRNLVSWNSLLHGYVENGDLELALRVFDVMEEHDYIHHQAAQIKSTYLSLLDACAATSRRSLELIKAVHSRLIRDGFCSTVLGNKLIFAYAKCGSLCNARMVFESINSRSVVSWNSLIQAYMEAGQDEAALQMVTNMDLNGIKFNSATFVFAIGACSNLFLLDRGKAFHAEFLESNMNVNLTLATGLVELYSRCGAWGTAMQMLNSIPDKKRCIDAWNILLRDHGAHGNTKQVFEIFELMKEQGVAPNDETFSCVLNICSHAGLTSKGIELFYAMEGEFGIKPGVKHFGIMVDLLGRGNHLDEALNFLRCMPYEPSAITWRTLLAASRAWKNVEVGREAYEAILKLDKADPAAYILMEAIYKDAGDIPPIQILN